jgi:hypothetical protein
MLWTIHHDKKEDAVRWVAPKPKDEYKMSIEIRGMASSEIIKLIPDEYYARKSVVDYWNTCQRLGRRVVCINLWKNFQAIDTYFGEGNWAGGRKAVIVEGSNDDDCDF